MSSTKEELFLELYFSSGRKPELQKAIFKVAGEEEFERTRKTGKFDNDPNRFDWKSGTQGFILALVDYRLRGQARRGFYDFTGAMTASPAASACGVIEKQQWLQSGFGYESGTEQEIAKNVFKVRKNQADGSIALQIDSERLQPQSIRFFLGKGAQHLTPLKIEELRQKITWKSHRRQSGLKSTPHREVLEASAISAPRKPAGDSAEPTTMTPTTPPPHEPTGEAPANYALPPPSRLKIWSLRELEEHGWKLEETLPKWLRIDYETISNLSERHEGSVAQWLDVVEELPASWRLLVDEATGEIVGYWHFVPLSEESYDLAKTGKLYGSDVTIDKVPFLLLPGRYKLYFVGFSLLRKHKTLQNFRLLFEALLRGWEEFAESDIIFEEVCANAYTDEGLSLCKTLGMQKVCNHEDRGEIYSMRLLPLASLNILNQYPRLRELYAAAASQQPGGKCKTPAR